jgi:hypothetical protein
MTYCSPGEQHVHHLLGPHNGADAETGLLREFSDPHSHLRKA